MQCVGGHRAGGGVLDRQEGEGKGTCAVVVLTATLTASSAVVSEGAVCDYHVWGAGPQRDYTVLRQERLRIRKEKEGEAGGSIVSLSTTQLLCRPSNKQETLSGQSPCQA